MPLPLAGADIKEISELDAAEAGKRRYLEDLCVGIKAVKKPILAALEGIAVSAAPPSGIVAKEWVPMAILTRRDKYSWAAASRLP